MRNKDGKKVGALTPAECYNQATKLINTHGICLFLLDIKNNRKNDPEERIEKIKELIQLADELNQKFADDLPKNKLANGIREEKGFDYFLGDSTWAAITNPETVNKIINHITQTHPTLNLYYGIAKDGWDEGMKLVK